MIPAIKHNFLSEDLPGFELTSPVKSLHEFFSYKVEIHTGWRKWTWRAVQIVPGCLAYALLGLLALIGMIVNCFGISALRKSNENTIKDLLSKDSLTGLGINSSSGVYSGGGGRGTFKPGYEMKSHEYQIQWQNGVPDTSTIENAIRECSRQMQRANIKWAASSIEGSRNFSAQLLIFSRSPYKPN